MCTVPKDVDWHPEWWAKKHAKIQCTGRCSKKQEIRGTDGWALYSSLQLQTTYIGIWTKAHGLSAGQKLASGVQDHSIENTKAAELCQAGVTSHSSRKLGARVQTCLASVAGR